MATTYPAAMVGVMLSLWGFAAAFAAPLRKKKQASKKIIVFVIAGFLCQLLLFWAERTIAGWMDWLFYPLELLLAVGFFAIFTDIRPEAVAYGAIWTVINQQGSKQLCMVILFWLNQWQVSAFWSQALCLCCTALHCLVIWCTLARWMPDNGRYDIGPRQMSAAVFSFLVFEGLVLYSQTSMWKGQPWESWRLTLIMEIYCATLLYFQHEMFKKSALRREVDILNRMQAQQREQYALSKENIALINRKCHDLKHQVAAMRVLFEDERRENYLEELESAVRIYEAIAQTGNEVLDTVLTEKSLYCEANSITAHCVADGHLLDFMDPVDLYTIFGNALDNAIDSVKKISTVQKRIIDVLVYQENQFLVIQIINPVEEQLSFDEEGLPITTKSNNGYHGFGLKSIRHIVHRYEGFLTVKVENGCFCLRILLPMSQQKNTAQATSAQAK